jgi:hypothetical protein
MATVFFDKQFTNMVNNFCDEKNPITKRPIFSTNLNFMVFAAMVGRRFNHTCEHVQINRGTKEIKEVTFNTLGKDGVAFLLARGAEQSGEILRDGRENELYKYIENYAFLGCQEIEKWMSDRLTDNPYEVLLEKIMAAAEPLVQNNKNHHENIDVDI